METVTVTFKSHGLLAAWYLPTRSSANRCSYNGAQNGYTCTLADGQSAKFRVGGFNFFTSGWIDVHAAQDGESADPVRITVEMLKLF